MKRGHRIAIVGVVALAVILVGWGTLWAAVWMSGGVLTVSIDRGPEAGGFYLAVPVALVDVAATAGRHVLDGGDRMRLEAHLGDWQPLVRTVLEVLADCPDATLVEVIDGDEHVRVLKRGDALEVEIDDSEISLRVSLPARSLARTARRILS